ncbi:hypothetical protein EYD10_16502 [Varanus komodoensis]|nr:hypothetical protein EYD10_16502 [Varanus komodoensis]
MGEATSDDRLPVRTRESHTAAALRLMEESLLLDQNFRHKAEKLLGIFQSELFQALLGAYGDIQEFYEVTVSDSRPTTSRRHRPKQSLCLYTPSCL